MTPDYVIDPLISEDEIAERLDALADDVTEWPEAAIQFMYMIKAHDEAYQPTPEEIRANLSTPNAERVWYLRYAMLAGISLEEITAAIQLLSNAGIQGEMAGSTLLNQRNSARLAALRRAVRVSPSIGCRKASSSYATTPKLNWSLFGLRPTRS